ncbi:MAG: DUF4058 family protein [Candidatus Entotheonellia bacterium]
MPSPFPGMDPYLERRSMWPDVHNSFIVGMRDALAPQVAPAYYVAIEERTYLVALDIAEFIGRPDAAIVASPTEARPAGEAGPATAVASMAQTVLLPLYEEVREGYLEIRAAQTHALVTAIEMLSPSNKAPGEGRRVYEETRRRVLSTLTNLVEIDLLRGGEPMEMQPPPQGDYRMLVRAGWERPYARLYTCSVRHVLPEVPVPLRRGEQEARLHLSRLLADLYDRARYDLRLDYRQLPEPPLSAPDADWADELLRARGLR